MTGAAQQSAFRSTLQAEEVDEMAGVDVLLSPLFYFSVILRYLLTVPAGFKTDYASVPRWLPFAYAMLGGQGRRAAVVHDWLYKTQSVERATADAVFREALLACGYSNLKASMFYAGVRSGGWVAWNQHAKENALEKQRVVPQTRTVLAAMEREREVA